jgi:hypothetical protein
MNNIERGREEVEELRRVEFAKRVHLVRIWRNDLLAVLAYISYLERVEAAARGIEPPPDETCKGYMVRADAIRKLCQALGGDE